MATTYRVRFVLDTEARFEECNGQSRPLTEEEYAVNYYNDPQGNRVSYADYLRYQGNPDRHVFLACQVQKQCDCCNAFNDVQSLWGIDCMDDNPEYLHTRLDHWYSFGEVNDDPRFGYLRDVARELVVEEETN